MATYDKEIEYGGQLTHLMLKQRYIYGSSRVGVRSTDIDMLTLPSQNYSMKTVKYNIGARTYELSNHLGNVLSVISDKVIPVFDHGVISGMLADIRSAQDYSPFGVTLSGRNYTLPGAEGSRYGYQGSEKDNELKGEGNSYTTHFRLLDPRLGRWLSLDPVFQPHQSPYNSMDNNPILFNDPFGDVIDYGVKGERKRELKKVIRTQRKVDANFAQLYNTWKNDPNEHVLFPGNFTNDTDNKGANTLGAQSDTQVPYVYTTTKVSNINRDPDNTKKKNYEYIHKPQMVANTQTFNVSFGVSSDQITSDLTPVQNFTSTGQVTDVSMNLSYGGPRSKAVSNQGYIIGGNAVMNRNSNFLLRARSNSLANSLNIGKFSTNFTYASRNTNMVSNQFGGIVQSTITIRVVNFVFTPR